MHRRCPYQLTTYINITRRRGYNIAHRLEKMNQLTVSDIKSKQFMLITKAGLAVCETKEKGQAQIEKCLMEEFTEAVKGCVLPQIFSNFNREAFFRTKNFGTSISDIDSNDLHTGATLWRKFKEIRLILMNEFSPLLASKMPGGILPSGKSFAEILLIMRRQLHDRIEDLAEKRSKAVKGYKRNIFKESWYPAEWEAFTTYGMASPNPADALNAR